MCVKYSITLDRSDRKLSALSDRMEKNFPGLKYRYMSTYGNAYDVQSPDSAKLMRIMKRICKANGMMSDPDECFKYMNDLPDKQISIFDL